MSHLCNFCGLHFNSLPSFYRHRTGEVGARRCLSELEMFAAGLHVGRDYTAASTSSTTSSKELITKAIERSRPIYIKKESIEKSHVRWCLDRGIHPQRIVDAGINTKTVAKIFDEEIQKLKGKS